MHKTIGIIGGGVVGLAVKRYYETKTRVLVYDKYKKYDSWEDTINQDIIFLCVPTPYNHGFDGSALEEVFEKLAKEKSRIVVIKSTVIVGTTDKLQERYPHLKILFNPEFLCNNTAVDDFADPDKQIVGYTEQSQDIASDILEILPRAKYRKVVLAKAAEMVKYMVNSYYATKVIFANQIYDLCKALGVDYDTVREAFESDKRVAPGNFDVWHGGYRGFSGKCLPKDVSALIDCARENNVNFSLLEEVKKINEELLKNKDGKK